MNILNDLVNEEISEFDCGPYIPYSLFIDCLIENGFDVTCCEENLFKIPNKEDHYIKWEVNSNNNVIIKLVNQIKFITVDISECLSTTVDLIVPEDFKDYNNKELLEKLVKEQIVLPSEEITKNSEDSWIIDDFCISIL